MQRMQHQGEVGLGFRCQHTSGGIVAEFEDLPDAPVSPLGSCHGFYLGSAEGVEAVQALACPAESANFYFEGELAVIIGRGGRRIPEQRALEHVAGHSCYNHGSVRDWQRHTS